MYWEQAHPSREIYFSMAQLGDGEQLLEVCGTLSSSLSPHSAVGLPDVLVLMGESQLQPWKCSTSLSRLCCSVLMSHSHSADYFQVFIIYSLFKLVLSFCFVLCC